MRHALFAILALTITANFTTRAAADLPNLIAGIEMTCTEQGQRLQSDWTGTCEMARMNLDLFFLPHDLRYPATRDLVDFLKMSETEPAAAGIAHMIMDSLQFVELHPARNPSARDPDPEWIFALPSPRDAFCQFGYVPVREREAAENEWQDWRRFRCYIDLGEVYLVHDFTPKAWQVSTSYFVSLIVVLLSR